MTLNMTHIVTLVATYAVALAGIASGVRLWWKANRRLHRIIDVLEFVEAELKPNHGSSLRDAIDRLERDLSDHIKYHIRNGDEDV